MPKSPPKSASKSASKPLSEPASKPASKPVPKTLSKPPPKPSPPAKGKQAKGREGVTHGPDAPFGGGVRMALAARDADWDSDEDHDDDDNEGEDEGKRSEEAEFGNFKVSTLELPASLQRACARVLADGGVPNAVLRRDAEQLAQSLVSLVTLPPHRDVVHGRVPATFSDLLAAGQVRGLEESGDRMPGAPPPAASTSAAVTAHLATLFDEVELAKLEPDDGRTVSAASAPDARPVRNYGSREAHAYVAYRMAPIYGSVSRVLQELYYRLPRYNPKSMLDFGTGPGTAIWAAHHVYDGSVKEYLAVDISESMLNIADALITPSREGDDADLPRRPTIPGVRTQRFLGQATNGPTHDLVLASYVLGEIPSRALREATLASLWEHTRDLLVLIEPGTPQGFANILQARELFLGSRTAVHPAAANVRSGSPLHIVAPCPHEAACPMKANTWCHFVQRVARTDESRLARGNVHLSYEDEKFSYLVLRRGPRPTDALATTPRPVRAPSDSSSSSSSSSSSGSSSSSSSGSSSSSSSSDKDELEVASLSWPRLVRQPMRRTGHVILDLCSPPGVLERRVVPKSQGKRVYKDARNNFWGNLWPHALPSGKKRVSRP